MLDKNDVIVDVSVPNWVSTVLIIDDVLATGGTILAAISLARRCGAIVEKVLVLMEIDFLEGRKRIAENY